ncbi:sterol desaturase family protein [Legionella sp. W05-934-2]|uniref:sterol desaturase family protein n=1 Tax=Legionella sp. W05-934-2 TaxID=1198649 RepID=UPI0034628EB9
MDTLDFQFFSASRTLVFFIIIALFIGLEYFFCLHKIGKAGFRRRRLLNWELGIINMLLMFPVSTLGTALYCQYYQIGLFYSFQMSWWQVFVAWFLIYDLFFYLFHRVAHSRLLWHFHIIHHTETSMNVTTSFRFHPIEFSLFTISKVCLIFIMGPWFFILLISDLIQTTIVLFGHSNLKLNTYAEKALSYIIITPRYHLMHHRYQCNCNYATGLTIWDKIGGTYCNPVWTAKELNSLKLGQPQLGRQDDLNALLLINKSRRLNLRKRAYHRH